MRVIGRFLLVLLGFVGGVAASAAVVKRAVPSRGDEESDEVGLVAVFDGAKLASRSRAFRGGSALAWFGGVALDLRDAELAEGARLSVGALMGGVAVRVPPHWRVESSVRTLAGGVEVAPPAVDDPDAPVLTVDGFALMGGVAVGSKRVVAESAVGVTG